MLAPQRIGGRHLPVKIAAPEKQGSPHQWKFSSKVNTGPQFSHGFQPSVWYMIT
jgi:hypothetical protein